MARVGVLTIHGMGSQQPGFSTDMVDELRSRLGNDASEFDWQEVYWADALKPREDSLWTAMNQAIQPNGRRVPLDWASIREFVMHNFGDALAYHRDSQPSGQISAYDAIHDIVSADVGALKARLPTDASVVILGHSLGALVMSDYIWDRQRGISGDPRAKLDHHAGFVSFGCNIPLFSLAYATAVPIRFPGDGIPAGPLRTAGRWLNYLDRDDVLGWPLKVLYERNLGSLNPAQQDTVARIDDYEINVGSFLSSWNPAAHSKYWTDNDFTRPVADYLSRILAAL